MLITKHLAIGKRIVLIFVSMAVFLSAALATIPISVRGKHCPTAKLQEVVVQIRQVTCCGKTVVTQLKRAPQLGEKGFVQCHCEDKKAAKANKSAIEFNLLTWFIPYLVPTCGSEYGSSQKVEADSDELVDTTTIPLTPPPNFF